MLRSILSILGLNQKGVVMKKSLTLSLGLLLVFGCLFIVGCSGGDKAPSSGDEKAAAADTKSIPRDQEQIKRFVQSKMKKMQDKIKDINEKTAVNMAQKEAKKWDSKAKLYSLEGEEFLKPDGTAKHWTAYFAVREDPDNTPRSEQGKKFVVLMLGGKTVRMEKKETPKEISYTKECHAFLPDGRMSGKAAYDKCFAALKEKYGDKADTKAAKRLECFSGQYYISSKWIIKPTWRLTLEIDNHPVSAAIHALTGEVLRVK